MPNAKLKGKDTGLQKVLDAFGAKAPASPLTAVALLKTRKPPKAGPGVPSWVRIDDGPINIRDGVNPSRNNAGAYQPIQHESEGSMSGSGEKLPPGEWFRYIAMVLLAFAAVWSAVVDTPTNRAHVQLATQQAEIARHRAEEARYSVVPHAAAATPREVIATHVAVSGETFRVTNRGDVLFRNLPTSISGGAYTLSMADNPSVAVSSSQGWGEVRNFLAQAGSNWVRFTGSVTVNMM